MEAVLEVASRYAIPAAAATVGAMYLDAKHHIVKDISEWYASRKLQRIVAEGAQMLGDYYTLYHMLELNDPAAEAFWFEGRGWTFGDVRREASKLAQWFLDHGVQTKGMKSVERLALMVDFVAVYMTNSAEAYFAAFALSKLGVTNAMINSSLKGMSACGG
jgi:hypothetical protein